GQCWVYATEFPLGHSPTVVNNVAYVGGFDRKIHAINATSCQNGGQRLWAFEAGAGFDTNPLVVNNMVYAGNRDGKFYAIHASGANKGEMAWSYPTGGPIHYSAAYKNGVVYFASNDSHAYALNATSGALVWKSAKLPGDGFHSWWPVIYENKVIFSGSNNYRTSVMPGSINDEQFSSTESKDVFPNRANDPRGTLVGAVSAQPGKWVAGTPTINANRIVSYFNQKPYRRTVFVLNQSNGAEPNKAAAPVLWTGTHSGTRYPPVIGSDGVLYQQNNYMSDPFINGGQLTGWVPNNQYISYVSADWAAVDEPHAASAGGNLIYWNLCCDRQAGSFDITIPKPPGGRDNSREWWWFNYDLQNKLPNYNEEYTNVHNDYTSPYANFGNINGIYGFHGDTNPPIPYNGRVYMHRSNAIIAFEYKWPAPSPTKLATAQIPSPPAESLTPIGVQGLTSELESEIQKMVNVGHLRPAYMGHGILDFNGEVVCGDDLVDYWHNSAETLYTLTMAYPYLSTGLQNSVKTYLQNEYSNYPPYLYNHVGWDSGAAREAFSIPNDIASQLANVAPRQENPTFKNNGGWNGQGVWQRNPFAFYALWKYAELMGNPVSVWNASKNAFWNEFNRQPSDSLLLNMPYVHNIYIAAYTGWLGLEQAAGKPKSNNVQTELNRLLALRANNFTKDTAYMTAGQSGARPYCRSLNISSNFLFMVPELANYLKTNALNKVQTAVNEYETLAPYWFVTLFEGGYAENVHASLFDTMGLFTAKSWILDVSGDEMEKYLDVPAFAVGDLYYIQKLVMAIENQAYGYGFSLSWPSSGKRTID
ncbi:MAG: PQQ-binding-like beta-propeller repeat protein, partial [Anaerolineae bacterium]